jgi:NADH dehydrogenase
MGIETVTGDIKNADSLKKVFEGAGTVISTASSTLSRTEGDSIETVDKQGQINVVKAADAAGVDQFIFVSFLKSSESFPLQDAKRKVEEAIQESDLNYTIFRPTFFMEVWLGPHLGFDAANGTATIYGEGNNKISWIAIKDVAAFVVASVDNPSARKRIIDLGGPEAISPLEVVRLFEKQTGKRFELNYLNENSIRAQKDSTEDPLQKSFAGLMLTYAGGAVVPMEDTMKRFSLDLVSVKDFSNMFSGAEAAV